MKAYQYSQEEDPLVGILSNPLLGGWRGRTAVETGWGGFRRFVKSSGSRPNIVEKCSEETQSTWGFSFKTFCLDGQICLNIFSNK
jgi:hypothetical protein